MSYVDKHYLTHLRELMFTTNKFEGRNGRVSSIFGHQMRFDLAKEFPILLSKRVHFQGMVDELLWFISGSTNVNDLPTRTQPWWTPWAKADGGLGPIYGESYRQAAWWYEVEPKVFDVPEIKYVEGLFCGVGDIGPSSLERGQSDELKMLKNTWREMLKRCYGENIKSFKSYGEKGIHVDPEWLEFENFKHDAVKLQGWALKKAYPDDYSLDKDVLYASNRYSKETCIWASHREQSLNTSTGTPFYATSPSGEDLLFASIGEMATTFEMSLSAIHRALNGKLKSHHGWTNFRYVSSDKVLRFRAIDQLKRLIAGIKDSPHSRRHMINLWHTPAMEHAELPCCHGSVIQFYVDRYSRLSVQVYQRSADWFIGVPVNLASYGLLLILIARECGLSVGELVYTFGDTHLYGNHSEAAIEQLSRYGIALDKANHSKIVISDHAPGIFDLESHHIELIGYDPLPTIKAPVSI